MDLRVGAAKAMLSSRKILQLWEKISKDELSESESLKLLQLIVDFYIQIRGFSFAENIKQKFKVLAKENTKGKGSLRKGLQKASQSSVSN